MQITLHDAGTHFRLASTSHNAHVLQDTILVRVCMCLIHIHTHIQIQIQLQIQMQIQLHAQIHIQMHIQIDIHIQISQLRPRLADSGPRTADRRLGLRTVDRIPCTSDCVWRTSDCGYL